MKILLVEPEFPIPAKSKNHKNFLPIGLLKLASYHMSEGNTVALVRGNSGKEKIPFYPDQILVTSLFTYWRKQVKDSVQHYKRLFPLSKVIVGGIYASLLPSDCAKYTGCDSVFIGVHQEAEEFPPAYQLVANPHGIDYQIVHASRGCIRHCVFCGAKKIEPKFAYKKSIKNEICSNRLIFYDNNLLANPCIEGILEEIASVRFRDRPVFCESQCGFDGRLLTASLAKLLRKARFGNPRIAWDGPFVENKEVERQINLLTDAGYSSRDIYVFMIYNWDIDFTEMEKKRKKCWEWKVQISDCRYRPLDQLFDNYKPLRKQTSNDYFIHPIWTDMLVKKFRRNVRTQNICVRMGFTRYVRKLEQKGRRNRAIRKEIAKQLEQMGYLSVKVRQVVQGKDGTVANVKVGGTVRKVTLSSKHVFGNRHALTVLVDG